MVRFNDIHTDPIIVEDLRKFKFDRTMGWKKNEELVPPPSFASQPLPNNWAWYKGLMKDEIDGVEASQKPSTVKPPPSSTIHKVEHIQTTVEKVPSHCPYNLPNNPKVLNLLGELKSAFEERPIWSQRALANRMSANPFCALLTSVLHYVGYQFLGGPFRDCVIKYGVDPRTDNKYAMYQSMIFKAMFHEQYDAQPKTGVVKAKNGQKPTTHIFDGKKIHLDGKSWQLCDITEPVLLNLIQHAPLRQQWDPRDGYLPNGSWGKISNIMRAKILGLLYNLPITDHHISTALTLPDEVPTKQPGNQVTVLFPNFTDAEVEIARRLRSTGVERLRRPYREPFARTKRRDRILKAGGMTGMANGRLFTSKKMRHVAEAAKLVADGDIVLPTVEQDDQREEDDDDDNSKGLEDYESDIDGTTASEDFQHSYGRFGLDGTEDNGGDEGEDDVEDEV